MVTLAKEAALNQEGQAKTDRQSSWVDDLQEIVTVAHKPNPIQHATGFLAQDDFQT